MDDNNLAHSFLDRIKQTIFCKGKLHGAFYLKPRSEFQNRCAKNALSRVLIIIQARIVLVFLRSLFLGSSRNAPSPTSLVCSHCFRVLRAVLRDNPKRWLQKRPTFSLSIAPLGEQGQELQRESPVRDNFYSCIPFTNNSDWIFLFKNKFTSDIPSWKGVMRI